MKPIHARLLREGTGPPNRAGHPLRWSASAVRQGARVLSGARVGFHRRAGTLVHPGPGETARPLGQVESVSLQRAPDGALEVWARLRLSGVPRGLRRDLAEGRVGASINTRAWTTPATDGGPDTAHGLAPEDGEIAVDLVASPALGAGRRTS